jgi:hypothetical protein
MKNQPTDDDKVICPHCSGSFKLKEASFYNARFFRITRGGKPGNKPLQVVDTWNVPYSTGLFILSRDEVPKHVVEEFANEKAHFPFWPLQYLGKLWAKDTWDD